MDSLCLNDLADFLKKSARTDLKMLALKKLLDLTGNEEGCISIKSSKIGKLLCECISDENEYIRKTTCLSLVNISSYEQGCDFLLDQNNRDEGVIQKLLNYILDPNSCIADISCMILSNVSRKSSYATLVLESILQDENKLDDLINAFIKLTYNCHKCNLDYLGPVFSNLSQISSFRKLLLTGEQLYLKKLLPFIQYHESKIRKTGIVGTLRNCCFDSEHHDKLLGPDIDVLPCLLLPLAGPEDFSEEDIDKLPLELQYLGADKTREANNNIRKMLLEALNQLCATKFGREFLRDKNTYLILREYHKWEKEKSILLVCENIIDILIRTEEEINEDNLKELQVPEEYVEKFEKMDQQYLED